MTQPLTTKPTRLSAFRPMLVLLSAFVLVSVAMEAVLIVETLSGNAVDVAIWIRCSLVLGSSIVLLILAMFAARRSRPAWRRLSVIAPIVVVAVIVIVSIPGFLPDWVRVEQAVCGLLVLPVAIMLNLPRTRALFAGRA
jgi:hypothetical protein